MAASKCIENKLITVKCKTGISRYRPFCLMGLVNMQKSEEDTEGWVMIFSGDPLIPHELVGSFKNQVEMDKLGLTEAQRKELIKSSLVRDGNVYLYAGYFRVGKCLLNKECHQGKLNVLKVLSRHMKKHTLEWDLSRVVPMKEKDVNKVVMPKEPKKKGGYRRSVSANLLKQGEVKCHEALIFREKNDSIYVDLECPTIHLGYQVEIMLTETFVCKPNVVDIAGRRKITRILDQADIDVGATLKRNTVFHEHCVGKKTVKIFGFDLPTYEAPSDRRLLEDFMVGRLEYRVMANFIRDGERYGAKMEKVLVKEVDTMTAIKPKEEQMTDTATVATSSSSQDTKTTQTTTSSSETATYCAIPLSLLWMEVELEDKEGNAVPEEADFMDVKAEEDGEEEQKGLENFEALHL